MSKPTSKETLPDKNAEVNKSQGEGDNAKVNGNTSPKKASEFGNFIKSPAVKSVALHGLILTSLLVSFNFSAKPLKFVAPEASASPPQPDIVKATFIDSNVIQEQQRAKAQSEASARKRQQDTKRAEDKRKEDVRKKQVAEARKKREAQEEIEQQKQDEKNKREQEREIAEQRVKEAQEKAEQKKRQEELDNALSKQLEEEQASMSQANQKRVLSEVQKYKALVHSKVQQFLETDGGFIGETCLVRVQLSSTGLVLTANAVSGKPALCRVAKAAILRAQTLPVSKDPDVMAQFRQFDIEVSPER